MSSNGTQSEILSCLSSYGGKLYRTDYQRHFIDSWCFNNGTEFFGEHCSFLADGKLPSKYIAHIFVFHKCFRKCFRYLYNFNTAGSFCCFDSSVFWPNMYLWHDCWVFYNFSHPCFWLRSSMYRIWCIFAHCFPKRYTLIITKKRVFATLTVICLISFFQRIFYVLGTQYDAYEYAKKVVLGIDIVVIFLVSLTRILTIKVARDHCKNLENLNLFSKFDWILTKFVSKI